MSEKVPTTQVTNSAFQCGIGGALFLGLGVAYLINMGYEHGLNQSRKILRRHDKDVRRMYKREKQIYKEHRKEQQRGNQVQTGYLRLIKKP